MAHGIRNKTVNNKRRTFYLIKNYYSKVVICVTLLLLLWSLGVFLHFKLDLLTNLKVYKNNSLLHMRLNERELKILIRILFFPMFCFQVHRFFLLHYPISSLVQIFHPTQQVHNNVTIQNRVIFY